MTVLFTAEFYGSCLWGNVRVCKFLLAFGQLVGERCGWEALRFASEPCDQPRHLHSSLQSPRMYVITASIQLPNTLLLSSRCRADVYWTDGIIP